MKVIIFTNMPLLPKPDPEIPHYYAVLDRCPFQCSDNLDTEMEPYDSCVVNRASLYRSLIHQHAD